MVSALPACPTRRDVAMTGEITLRGKVLPIGGVKEKLLAAHRAGLMNIILPKDNEKDLADIPKNVLDAMSVNLVETMDEVLKIALAGPLPARCRRRPKPPSAATKSAPGTDRQVERRSPLGTLREHPPQTDCREPDRERPAVVGYPHLLRRFHVGVAETQLVQILPEQRVRNSPAVGVQTGLEFDGRQRLIVDVDADHLPRQARRLERCPFEIELIVVDVGREGHEHRRCFAIRPAECRLGIDLGAPIHDR